MQRFRGEVWVGRVVNRASGLVRGVAAACGDTACRGREDRGEGTYVSVADGDVVENPRALGRGLHGPHTPHLPGSYSVKQRSQGREGGGSERTRLTKPDSL